GRPLTGGWRAMSTVARMDTVAHWIGGEARVGADERTMPVHDPASGAVCASVPLADAGTVDAAVAAAAAAFPGWRDTPLARRVEILFRFRELVAAQVDDLARVVVREHGKVLADARGEIRR